MGCGICTENQKIKSVSDCVPYTNSYTKSVLATSISTNQNKFTSVYRVGKLVSSSNLGEIREATHRESSHQRAVKIFLKSEKDVETYNRFTAEIKILQSLDHQNIIKLYECFEDDKRVFSVMEKVEGGDLLTELYRKKALNEKNAASVCKQLLSCTAYLHENQVVHRDLRPENIMLEENNGYFHLKVVDFGVATEIRNINRIEGLIGSAFFLAPEVLDDSYNELVDEWSIGVILYILLSGSPPFLGNNNEEIINRARSYKYSLIDPIWDKISSGGKDLITKLLSPIKTRISAREALSHPWIQSFGLYNKPDEDLTSRLLSNIHHFSYINRFRDAISLFISLQISSKLESIDLRTLFKKLDVNNDGKLTAEEMKQGLKDNSEIINADEYIDKIMKETDLDGNKVLDYNEFLLATLDENELISKANLRAAFEIFDVDKSGKISSSELQQIFCFGDNSIDMWDEVVGQADLNADGEIDFTEFCRFMIELANK